MQLRSVHDWLKRGSQTERRDKEPVLCQAEALIAATWLNRRLSTVDFQQNTSAPLLPIEDFYAAARSQRPRESCLTHSPALRRGAAASALQEEGSSSDHLRRPGRETALCSGVN
jgi:hypothetical protein